MKIAILAFSSLPKMGGAEIFTQNLIEHLTDKGHSVDLYLPLEFYKRYKDLPLSTSNVRPILFRELGLLRKFPFIINFRLWAAQLLHKYDIWQVVGVHPAAHATRMVSKNVPVIVRAFGADIQIDESINYGFRLKEDIDRKIKKTLCSVAQVTALTPSLADDFRSLGVPCDKITEIPNGVNISRFNSINGNDFKKYLGMGAEEKLILTTGRYHIKKGYEYIPQAVRILLDKGYRFKWLLVGKNLQEINYLIEKYDVSEHLIIKDEIGVSKGEFSLDVPGKELVELYKSADFYVLPSLIEGMSNAMLEAMAAGLPVITTDSPGCRDLVKDNVNGLIAKPKDSISLADKVELCFDEEYLYNLRVSVLDYIKIHSWDKISERYIELYKEFIN